MATRYQVPTLLLEETFGHFRACGRGAHECQIVWTSHWDNATVISRVVHPRHQSHGGGFELNAQWLHSFWLELAQLRHGIRVQIHTHPREAFHSQIDDRFPIIHSPGFLSLVIPDFGTANVGFSDAYLTEIQQDGRWREMPIGERLEVVE